MACLDTSVLLDLMPRSGASRRPAAITITTQLARAGEELVTTRFNVAELWVGVHRSTDPTAEQKRLEALLTGIDVLEFDDPAARLFGRITAHLYAIGRPAGDMDVLIASVALANGQSLVTANPKHFADVPGLVVSTY